ncbi:MAG: ankyrin repeat domain-containing protein [Candidatus Binatia bacterium]
MITAAESVQNKILGGKYRLVAPLGQGAMGVVYRAEQLDVEGHVLREVALKTLRPELARDPDFSRRFLREVRVAARLRNPHTVTVYDSGLDSEGELFYTMELVSGRTLKDVMRSDGLLPIHRVVKIVGQICEALAEAHGLPEPIVHRDIKPANVFVEERQDDDWVKVGDFGIAKVLGEETSGLSHSGASPGTPRYMSPEQWMGKEVDARADLYALGVMLYEMLTGGPPFSPAEGALALMYQHLQDPPRPLPSSIPPGICRQVELLLAKAPADRPANPTVVRQALEQALLGGEDGQRTVVLPLRQLANEQTVVINHRAGNGSSSPSTAADRAGTASSTSGFQASHTVVNVPEKRTGRWLTIAAGLTLVTMLGGGFWYLQNTTQPGQRMSQTDNGKQSSPLQSNAKASPKTDTSLIGAARTGTAETVSAALTEGTDVNARGAEGRTALMWAAGRGMTETVQLLLDKGGDVNLKDDEGKTALLWATSRPFERFGLARALADTVEMLLAHGADITVSDAEGKTALMSAAKNGYDDIVRVLLANNAPTDAQDKEGNTALVLATSNDQLDIVRQLLAKGAAVDVQNAEGKTALMAAAGAGYLDISRLLLANKGDLNLRDSDGRTALMLATNSGSSTIVQAVLAKGADPTLVTKGGRSALTIAALKGHVDIMQTLLSKGADINATDESGKTALMWAANEARLESIKALLAHGANINITDNEGRSALIWATAQEYIDADVDRVLTEIVEALLAKGADTTFRSGGEGRPALLWAAAKGHSGAVRALLAKNADAQAKDWTGKTALLLASSGNYAEIVELLIAAKAK